MKELDQIVLQKGFFASIKVHLCLTKGHLDNAEGQVEVESPRNGKLFLISFTYIILSFLLQKYQLFVEM